MMAYFPLRFNLWLLLGLAIALLLPILACAMPAAVSDTNNAPTLAPSAAPALVVVGATPVPTGETASVINIIDGDTIDVRLNGRTERVRYIGMDTPERGDFYYSEATEANQQLVEGQEVTLVKDVSETDLYGRLLRYVYLADGTFVNAELVRLGYAQVLTYPPDVRYSELFVQLQQGARMAGRGLWANPEDMPDLVMATAVPLATAPLPEPTYPLSNEAVCDCSGNRYNCGRFATHDEAQACYDYCLPIAGDVHDLDRDGDGFACESLP
jgi:micrococcal nuclease